ncbi:MAG TPA: CRISPR-associated endonuclease Cas1 [Magnetospirillum sp.]|nr:CRISPR-associated endonuclease Cas1 [Magnetospirillum sp.]
MERIIDIATDGRHLSVLRGLHPSVGIHHANRDNAFALADDLVEPFRPLVDALVVRLRDRGTQNLDAEAKRALAGLIAVDLPSDDTTTTVSGAAVRLAQSLAEAFQTGRASSLLLPSPPSPRELAELKMLVP